MRERLQGDESSGRDPREFDPRQLGMGVQVELEHTNDPGIALEIAMDHLAEDPRYYTKLRRIHVDKPSKRRATRNPKPKLKLTSKERYRASADERRRYGGSTVTVFWAQPSDDPSTWFTVKGYGKTPGERKTYARRKAEEQLEESGEGRGGQESSGVDMAKVRSVYRSLTRR